MLPSLAIDCTELRRRSDRTSSSRAHGGPSWCCAPGASLARLNPGGSAVGFHALPPLADARLVELTRNESSSPVAAARAERFFNTLGKHVAWVGDAPGLVLGRIVCQVINEAAFALGEGVGSAEDIDLGMELGVSHPRGPFAWADLIGLEHVLSVLQALCDEYREERYRPGAGAAPARGRRQARAWRHGRLPAPGHERRRVAGSDLGCAISHPGGAPALTGQMSEAPPPFQVFLDENRDAVWRFLVSSVGPSDAEDCFQETFISALRAYPRLRAGSNLRAWVLTIAHRKAVDCHRGRARRALPVAELETLDTRAGERSEPADAELWGAVRELPPRQRSAVVLRFLGDLPHREIAAAIGCSEEAARRSLHEGLQKLRTEVVA